METFSDYGIQVDISHGQARTTCPECSADRKKSNDRCLSVDVDSGVWLCQHCGWTGCLKDKKQFVQQVRPAKKTFTKPEYKEKIDLPGKVVSWFLGRGISEETLAENKIGYGPVYIPQVQKEVNAIHFPYYHNGEVLNIKHRDGNKNFCMVKGAERVLYGLDHINKFSTVIVEGEIDKLSFYEAGIIDCVSVPDGAPSENTKNYATKFSFLESAEDQISEVAKWVIAVDNDAPGVRLKDELVRRFGPERCWVVEWPDGCKDANDTLVNYGKDKLLDCFYNAAPVPVNGVFSVSDFKGKILDTYRHGFQKGELTGWGCVDELYTVRPGEWTLVTGIPASGKSEWLDALTVNLATNQGWVFGVLSLENLPLERHFAKLAEKYINLPFSETLHSYKMSEDDLGMACEWGEKHFKFLNPDEEDLNVDGILKLAKVLVFRHGINGLIIDPWNELDHTARGMVSETEHISLALGRIRKFAREHNIHVWIVAHPTKLQKDKDGKYPVPTPYDVAGSAHWRNKADNSITVHRPNLADKLDRRVEIHVQKIRFKEIGRVGVATLDYDVVSGRYIDKI